MEAAFDIQDLSKGLPVLIIKSKDEIVCTVSQFLGTGLDDEVSFNKDKIRAQYSDYLTLFLFMKLVGSEGEKKIMLRMGDVIQANMRLMTRNEKFLLSKSNVAYKLDATIIVKPFLSEILMFDDVISVAGEGNWQKFNGTGAWNQFKVSITRGYQ